MDEPDELLRQVIAEQAQGDQNFAIKPAESAASFPKPPRPWDERLNPPKRTKGGPTGPRGPSGWKSEWSIYDQRKIK